MLDQRKLLKAIGDAYKMCRESGRFHQADNPTAHRSTLEYLEFSTLTTHLMLAESVGDNQTELERIVYSLEVNRSYGDMRGGRKDAPRFDFLVRVRFTGQAL